MTMLWFPVLLAAASTCAPVDGWNAGRAGQPQSAACSAADYAEAYKLGGALHALRVERDRIEADFKSMNAAEQGAARRRQRQLQNDIEALHGVAVTHGWPHEGKQTP